MTLPAPPALDQEEESEASAPLSAAPGLAARAGHLVSGVALGAGYKLAAPVLEPVAGAVGAGVGAGKLGYKVGAAVVRPFLNPWTWAILLAACVLTAAIVSAQSTDQVLGRNPNACVGQSNCSIPGDLYAAGGDTAGTAGGGAMPATLSARMAVEAAALGPATVPWASGDSLAKHTWDDECPYVVALAFGFGSTAEAWGGLADGYQVAGKLISLHPTWPHGTGPSNVPTGAIVSFPAFAGNSAGHVAIYQGGGMIWGNWYYSEPASAPHLLPSHISEVPSYQSLTWVLPPASWHGSGGA